MPRVYTVPAEAMLEDAPALRDRDELFRELSREAESVRVREGEYLWREGDPVDCVLLLHEGSLEVVQGISGGDTVVVRTLDPGSVAGELAALDGLARSAAVRAATPCRVGRVPADRFREFVRQRPHLLEGFLYLQSQRVRSLTRQVTQTHQRAITDQLTKLYNYGFFVERLDLELDRAAQMGDAVSIALFDIDHFKQYNDTHGHPAGNVVLVTFADILKRTGRRGDIVARFGGEEFVFLLYGASRREARQVAEQARVRVEETDFPGGGTQPEGRITVSGGVATYPYDARTAVQLVEAADEQLYKAKADGRNRVMPEEPGGPDSLHG